MKVKILIKLIDPRHKYVNTFYRLYRGGLTNVLKNVWSYK